MTCKLTETELKINDITIPFFLIDDIHDIKETPSMLKVSGIEEDVLRKGIYQIDGYGNVNVYAQNINWQKLMIFHHGEYYLITPGVGKEFEEFRYNLIVSWELTYK